MSFVHEYPYTNFHELNADYLLKRLGLIENQIANIKEEIESEVFAYVQEVLARGGHIIAVTNAMDFDMSVENVVKITTDIELFAIADALGVDPKDLYRG